METFSALQPIPWDIVFGPNADPSLITDAKPGLDYILGDAVEAKISFNAAGESALAARFANAKAAATALNRYGSFFQFADVTGSDTDGWTARRFNGQGEWNHVVTAGHELYAWSGTQRKRSKLTVSAPLARSQWKRGPAQLVLHRRRARPPKHRSPLACRRTGAR